MLDSITLSGPVALDALVHPFQPGDVVYVKTWNPEPLKEKWKGPFQVLLVTNTALKVEGTELWVHHMQVKPATTHEIQQKTD